ncbi:MAG: Ser-Thr-rich GPI-anchored membrane family protein [Candidatus Delongbacteria bacterium]|nr:Ser-Thr-rich GPI-anchored membrane family protein [Candidatus Delongbacteria bacterium]
MYKRLLFIMIASVIAGMIFWSCSDDGGSTNPPATPSLKILSPNGGEIVQRGDVVIIHFENEITDSVAIKLYKNGEFLEDIESLVTTADSLEWLVPNYLAEGTDYQVMITSIENEDKYDLSDGTFTVARAGEYIIVTSPNGGGIWLKGSTQTITWYDNIAGGVNIFLIKNGVPVTDIFGSPQASNGSKSWVIPGTLVDGADYAIQIVSDANAAVNDISDSFFCLATNDNTQNIVGDWNAVGTWSKWASIWNFNADGTWINDYSETGTWFMTGNALRWDYNEVKSAHYLGIVDGNHMEGTMVNFESASTGTWYADRVIPELLTPNGGEIFMRGTTQTITWNPSPYGNIVINLVDSTGVVAPIATVADSLGTYDWSIPSNVEPGSAYLIRIEKEINSLAFDESDHYFCISADETVDILGEWNLFFFWGKAGPSVWDFNADNTWSGDGVTGTWALTGNGLRFDFDTFDTYYIGIVGTDKIEGTMVDGSGNPGTWYSERILEVLTPNGGDFYQPADVVAVTWYETLTAENVTLDLYENDVFYRNIGTVNVNTTPFYNWTVPANLTTSTKYKIRMTSTTSDIYDESDDYFTVDAVAPAATLDETFDDGTADGWTGVDGSWTVVDSVYTVASGSLGVSTTAFGTPMTGNYVMESRLRKTAGSAYNFGIVMNGDSSSLTYEGDWNNCAMFLITTDGTYSFVVSVGGVWTGISWTSSSDLVTGLGSWNTLKVIVDNGNNDYHIFINGVYQATLNNNSLTEGSVGLKMFDSGPAGTGEYDYVKVSPINKSAIQDIQIKRVDLKPLTSVNE